MAVRYSPTHALLPQGLAVSLDAAVTRARHVAFLPTAGVAWSEPLPKRLYQAYRRD